MSKYDLNKRDTEALQARIDEVIDRTLAEKGWLVLLSKLRLTERNVITALPDMQTANKTGSCKIIRYSGLLPYLNRSFPRLPWCLYRKAVWGWMIAWTDGCPSFAPFAEW